MKTIYTVRSGDSLSIIARDELDDMSQWPVIALLNSIEWPYVIRPGQVLWLPAGEPDGPVTMKPQPGQYDAILTGGVTRDTLQPGSATAPQPSFTPAMLLIAVAVAVAFWR